MLKCKTGLHFPSEKILPKVLSQLNYILVCLTSQSAYFLVGLFGFIFLKITLKRRLGVWLSDSFLVWNGQGLVFDAQNRKKVIFKKY